MANVVPSLPIIATLMIEALNFSETLDFTRATITAVKTSNIGKILHLMPPKWNGQHLRRLQNMRIF
jgi:hypothetical protein